MNIVVLRLGHRPQRDQRITTHVGLTARAMGAKGMLLASSDSGIEKSINDISERWGGSFFVRRISSWRTEIKKWKENGGRVLHLTMYGVNLPDVISDIINDVQSDYLLIVVGAEKVPPDIYDLADWNVAVGNQPHSEVAALAIVLDRLQTSSDRDPLMTGFPGGEVEIVPKKSGKEVISK